MIPQLIGITELIGIIAKHSELGALGSNEANGPKTPHAPPRPWAEILGVRGYRGGVFFAGARLPGGKTAVDDYLHRRKRREEEKTEKNVREPSQMPVKNPMGKR
jgi:hypothetical protein